MRSDDSAKDTSGSRTFYTHCFMSCAAAALRVLMAITSRPAPWRDANGPEKNTGSADAVSAVFLIDESSQSLASMLIQPLYAPPGKSLATPGIDRKAGPTSAAAASTAAIPTTTPQIARTWDAQRRVSWRDACGSLGGGFSASMRDPRCCRRASGDDHPRPRQIQQLGERCADRFLALRRHPHGDEVSAGLVE